VVHKWLIGDFIAFLGQHNVLQTEERDIGIRVLNYFKPEERKRQSGRERQREREARKNVENGR
jgi:hypothetical protein